MNYKELEKLIDEFVVSIEEDPDNTIEADRRAEILTKKLWTHFENPSLKINLPDRYIGGHPKFVDIEFEYSFERYRKDIFTISWTDKARYELGKNTIEMQGTNYFESEPKSIETNWIVSSYFDGKGNFTGGRPAFVAREANSDLYFYFELAKFTEYYNLGYFVISNET
jgi:hypothetical protein